MGTFFKVLIIFIVFCWILSKCGSNDAKSNYGSEINSEKEAEVDMSPEATKARILAAENDKIDAEKLAKEEALAEKKFYKSRAGRVYKKHPEWSKEDCQLLADNKIWIGMTYEMLKYKRGLPNSANPSNYGRGTQWQWCWHDYTPSCFYDHDDDGKIDSYN